MTKQSMSKFFSGFTLTFCMCCLGLVSTVAMADDNYDQQIKALEDELSRLKQQIAKDDEQAPEQGPEQSGTVAPPVAPGEQGSYIPMQRDTNAEYLTGKALLDDSFPNSIPLFGSETRFRVGGYAKLDVIQDFDYVGDRFEFELATIPVEGTPNAALDGRTTLHAKETRINFDFRRLARNAEQNWEFPLQAFLEIDFFDDREDFRLQPRLRHAYGVVGRFLAGQTWAITTDVAALAGTIDFSGGDALYGGRVAQVRFQDKIGESITWAVGIEDPQVSIGNPDGLDGDDRTSLPNFAGSMRWKGTDGSHVALGLDVFQLEWQGGEAGPSDKEFGYGATVSGRYPISSKDALVGAATVGSGSAHRVIVLSFDGGNDAVITPDGLDAMSHWQIYGGISHYWTKSLNSTFSVATAVLDNSEFQADDAVHQATSLHANLVWFPYKLVSTGVEYMWGKREDKGGADGTANRVQFMVKYQFN